MNILEALKEGKRARRRDWSCGLFFFMKNSCLYYENRVDNTHDLVSTYDSGRRYSLDVEDVLSDDWIIEEESTKENAIISVTLSEEAIRRLYEYSTSYTQNIKILIKKG